MAFMIPAVRNEYDIYLSRSPKNSGSPPSFGWTASNVDDSMRTWRSSSVCESNNNNVVVQNNNFCNSCSAGGQTQRRKTSKEMCVPQGKPDSALMEKLKRCDESSPS